MRELGFGIRMVVEEFFSENCLKMNVEMEISSNEVIK